MNFFYIKQLKHLLSLIFLPILTGCIVLDFSSPTQRISIQECITQDEYKPSVNVYIGKKEKFFIVPFFMFQWNKGDYCIAFDFTSSFEKYYKIDSIRYKIISNTTDGIMFGSIRNDNDGFFKCYVGSTHYSKPMCYATLKSDYKLKLLITDSIQASIDFDVYLTDNNKQTITLQYFNNKLSNNKDPKIQFFIIGN